MAAIGTLTIEMAANVARLQRDMDRARGTVDGAMTRIRSSVQLATRALGALGGALSIKAIVDQADAMNLLTSRLRLVTTSQQDLIRTQSALVSVANRTYTSISGTVDLYTALARSTKDLNINQNQLLTVVETFNKAIIISGGSVQSAQAAITQFNQAMASGVLRGEEFNSISEQAPMIMEMLSQSLGVTRGALRDMAKEGLLTADVVLAALQEGAEGVSKQFDQMDKTVGQATNQLTQSLSLLIAEMDKATGSTSFLAKGIDLITFSMNKFREAIAIGAVRPEIFNWLEGTFAKLPEQIQQTTAETARLTRQMNEAMKGSDEAVKGQARAILAAREEEEKRKKAAEELLKTYEKLTERLRGDIVKGTAALQAEQQGLNKAQEEFLELVSSPEWKQYTTAQKMLITNLYEQKIAIEQVSEAERKREKEKEENQKRLLKMINDETEARREWIAEDKKAQDERLKAQEKLYEEHRKQIQSINDQLTDALMRAFESGKGFGKAFKDTLVNMFRTMVLRPILAPIVGSLTAGMTGTAAASTGVDIISGTQTAFNMIVGGLNSVGATVSSALLRAGDYLATSSIDAVAAGGEFLQTISAGAGTAASVMAGYAAGEFARNLISGGYSLGKGMDNFQRIGIAVASFIGGPVLGAIVGALQGVFNRAFGRKLADVGIQGMFGPEGFAGQSFTFEKGGFFRSDKTSVSGLDPQLQAFFSQSFQSIQAATAVMAATLGQNAEEIFNFTKSIRLSFMGLNQEQIQNLVKETFEGLADDMAKLALGTDQFTRQGERASETLSRLYNSIFGVNAVLDTLNLNMLDFSLAGADAASQLIDLFGGIDQLRQATGAYYEAFYTDVERTEISLRQLTTTFGSLGLSLPETREQFRQLVEAQDLTTEAGRQMFASLINLAPAFDNLITGIDAISEAARLEQEQLAQLAEEQQRQLFALQESIANERYTLETRLLQAQGDVNALREREIALLDESNRGLLRQIFALQDQQEADRVAAQQADDLERRRQQQIADDDRYYADLRARAKRAREEAQRNQQEYIKALESTGNTIQKEILRLRGVTGTENVTAAQTEFAILTARARAGSAEAAARLPEVSRIISDLATKSASSQFDILKTQLQLAGSLEITLQSLRKLGANIPMFANGGQSNGGLAIVGEKGPELVNFSGPSKIYSAQRTANMMGGEEVALEIRALREENRDQSRAIVGLQSRMTRLLERWDGDGLPEERVVA